MPSERFVTLLSVAEERMRELHVPGVALGIVADGRQEMAGLGVADAERPDPVGPDTVFSIASITKTFTAGVLTALGREGTLALDDPVRRWVPQFGLADARDAERVTIRHLLTHTGGWIGEELPVPLDGDDALRRAAAACTRMRQVTPPGELFSYNNVGFIVAGSVIEAAAREPYEDVVRGRMLRALAMDRTDFVFPDDRDVAAEHTVRDGRPAVIGGWSSARSSRPVGGLRSSVRDLLRYAGAHLDGTLRLEQDAGDGVPTGAPDRAQGVGWALADTGGMRVFSHGGATVAHMSMLAIVPERRFAVVVLTNGALGGQLTGAVVRRALGDLGAPADATPAVRPAPPDAERHVGRYAWPTSDIDLARADGGYEMRLAWKGSVAARPAPAAVRLEFWDETHLVCREGWAKGAYADVPRPGLFRWGGRARPRAEEGRAGPP